MRSSLSFLCILISTAISAQFAGHGFVPNGGQWPENVVAGAGLNGGEFFALNDGWTFRLFQDGDFEAYHHYSHHRDGEIPRLHGHVVQVQLLGASLKSNNCDWGETIPGTINYIQNEVRSTALQAHNSLSIEQVYPGVGMLWETTEDQVKYSFLLENAESLRKIRLLWRGHEKIEIDESGNLVVFTSVGKITETAPLVWENKLHGLRPVKSRFVLSGDTLSFQLEEKRAFDHPLIIDPNVIFSTYSGATSDNWGFTATYDNAGRLYLGGIAFGFGFPASPGAFDTTFNGAIDVVIMRFSADGTNREYATFLGGNGPEQPHSLIVDGEELIIYGATGSSTFPVLPNAYDTAFSGGSPVTGTGAAFNFGSDIFLTRLSGDGSSLVGSTYINGSESDGINNLLRNNYGDNSRGEVNLDEQGNVIVASVTLSTDFPVTTPLPAGGAQDGVAFKMSGDLSQMIWSTYLGGFAEDAAFSLVAQDSLIYVTGATASQDYPSSANAHSPVYNGGAVDGFITALDATDGSVRRSTFIGTADRDLSFFIYPDAEGKLAVLGQSTGDIPMSHAVDFGDSTSRQFLQLYSTDLSQRLRSIRIGADRSRYDFAPAAFMIDSCGITYMSGWGGGLASNGSSTAGLWVSDDGLDTTTDGNDFYILAIDANWRQALYGTFFGGNGTGEHVDGGTSRFSPEGIISQAVCAGCGGTSNTPTFPANVWSTTNNSGNCNMLGFVIDFDLDTVSFGIRTINDTVCVGDSAFFAIESVNADSLFWDFGNGQSASGFFDGWPYASPGDYRVLVQAYNTRCDLMASDSASIHIIDPQIAVQLRADFDSCDVDREVLFSVDGSTDFFLLFTGDGGIIDSLPAVHQYAGPGNYQAYLSYFAGGCFSEFGDTVAINFIPPPTEMEVETEHIACALPLILETRITAPRAEFVSIDYGDGQQDSGTVFSWSHTYTSAGTYNVVVRAHDSLCDIVQEEIIDIQIGQEELAEVDFPNVFTPNGDGENDVLHFDEALQTWDILSPNLRIYNRWGTEVYSGVARWDGTVDGQAALEGVYFWILEWKNTCDEAYSRQGFVHLMR